MIFEGIRMDRAHDRPVNKLRNITLTRRYAKHAEGSCMIEMGNTKILCVATVEERQPRWMRGSGRGWVTAEYGMLPRATHSRSSREGVRKGGRTLEIQRLIGRSLRSVMDLEKLGKRTVWIDCDVIQADGGTRTAAITGGFIALMDACRLLVDQRLITELPIRGFLAAISCGIVDGVPLLDLDYTEDARCDCDCNFVMNSEGRFVEVQGTAEGQAFTREEFDTLSHLAESGVEYLIQAQKKALLTGSL